MLDRLGPSLWIPTAAPPLTALDAQGEPVTLADYRGRNVLLFFYLGEQCVHCIEQITLAEERVQKLADLNAVVLAVSKDSVAEIARQSEDLGVTLLSDREFTTARRYRSYDDFEEIELHSTFLIDARGRVHWSRIGGDPFTDFDFIESELERLGRTQNGTLAGSESSAARGATGGGGR